MAKNIEDLYGLSPIQQGLLYEQLHQPASGVYVEQLSITFAGAMRPDLFGQAWQAVVDRHPILRTSFHWNDKGEPLQVVHRSVSLPLDLQDWRDLPADEQERRYQAWLVEERLQGFDLTAVPLMRVSLIRRDENTWTFAWRFSHLLMDGWSFGLAIVDFFACYRALYRGEEPGLPEAVPYRNYVGWWHGRTTTTEEKFWREELEGFEPVAPLGFAPDPVEIGMMGVHDYVHITLGDLADELQVLAKQHQLTLPTITQAAWILLHSRHLGTDDLVTGVTIAHRPPDLPGAGGILGPMIVTLPVRAKLDPAERLSDWLRRFQAEQAVMREQWSLPLVEIQRLADVPMPLLQTTVSYENVPMPQFQLDDVNLSLVDAVYDGRTHYPITMVIMPGDDMPLRIMHDLRHFGRDAGRTVAAQLRALLEQMVRHPDTRIGDFDPRPQEEIATFAAHVAEPLVPVPQGTLQDRFTQWVQRQPTAIAVRCGDVSMTYWRLDQTANGIAHLLRARGIGAGSLVGLCVERSADLVVAVLAVLKAGAAYVPLDPEYPPERLRYLADDADLPLVLASGAVAEVASALGRPVLRLDDRTLWPEASAPPAVDTTGDDLAYVLYTSGSTGQPKGARVTHRGVLSLLAAAQETFGFGPEDVWTLCHSYAFDYTVWEMWGALAHGGAVVVVPPGLARDPLALQDLVATEGVTVLSQTPAAFEQFAPRDDLALRYVFLGADRLDPRTLKPWAERDVTLVNLYGLTETSVVSTFHRIGRDEIERGDGASVIGSPLPNQRLYLLDPSGKPVPIGVPGEIHVSGPAVGLGYHGRDELTGQRFLPDPFVPGETMYRTGDLARRHPDGELEYLGRADGQVKVRGFRIEPGEIESELRAHPNVLSACVIVRSGALMAYVVPDGSRVPEAELYVHLRERLPAHMVPAAVGWIDAVPMTPNGKIDHAALPDLRVAGQAEQKVAPRTDLERRVADVVAAQLELEDVGVLTDLGQLGLHSVLAMRLSAALKAMFGADVPVSLLLVNPTVERIAQAVAGD